MPESSRASRKGRKLIVREMLISDSWDLSGDQDAALQKVFEALAAYRLRSQARETVAEGVVA